MGHVSLGHVAGAEVPRPALGRAKSGETISVWDDERESAEMGMASHWMLSALALWAVLAGLALLALV